MSEKWLLLCILGNFKSQVNVQKYSRSQANVQTE